MRNRMGFMVALAAFVLSLGVLTYVIMHVTRSPTLGEPGAVRGPSEQERTDAFDRLHPLVGSAINYMSDLMEERGFGLAEAEILARISRDPRAEAATILDSSENTEDALDGFGESEEIIIRRWALAHATSTLVTLQPSATA